MHPCFSPGGLKMQLRACSNAGRFESNAAPSSFCWLPIIFGIKIKLQKFLIHIRPGPYTVTPVLRVAPVTEWHYLETFWQAEPVAAQSSTSS